MGQTSTIEAEVKIKGDLSGQFVVGNCNLLIDIDSSPGAIVNVASPTDQPLYLKRRTPVYLRPRKFPSLLDREGEVAAIQAALQISTPVSIYGAEGIGKTSLVRQLTHLPDLEGHPDGVVHVDALGHGREDLLQSIFHSFCESQPNFKPTDTEIRIALQELKALIFLDNLDLPRDEVMSLLDLASGCVYVLASVERSLWGEGEIIFLQGLPEKDALTLFQRGLSRSMNEEEQDAARKICVLLHGHPLYILQAASLASEKSMTISAILQELEDEIPEKAILQTALKTLTEQQERVLALLAASGGSAIPLEHLVSLAQDPDVRKSLQGLIALGLVQAHSPRYSLTGDLASSLITLWDVSSWEDTLLNYFINWLEGKPTQTLIEESAGALIHIVKRAGERERWPEVIRLGRALERYLILWKRWQAWAEILNLILKAAKTLGDRNVEAWALHQLGSRAMCLGQVDQARELLTEALNIRKAIKDKPGLKVTQHNLNVLLRGTVPPRGGKPGGRNWFIGGLAITIALLLAATAAYVVLSLTVPPKELPFPGLQIYLFSTAPPAPLETLPPIPTELPVDTEGPQITDYYREPTSNWICMEDRESVSVYGAVIDPSGVASVFVEYQFNGADHEVVDMEGEGDVFKATIGNLQEGSFTFSINATDNSGNSNIVEGQDLSVFRCAGLEPYKDLPGLDLSDTGIPVGKNNLAGCYESCSDNNECIAFTYVPANGSCWLKYGQPLLADDPELISGVVRPDQTPPEIADLNTSPSSSPVCTQDYGEFSISSAIRDLSGTSGATLTYSFIPYEGDSISESISMQQDGDVFFASLDTSNPGELAYHVEAWDVHENHSQTDEFRVTFWDCDGLALNKDLPGLDFPTAPIHLEANNPQACRQLCIEMQGCTGNCLAEIPACAAFAYVPANQACWLKYGVPLEQDNPDVISGVVRQDTEPPMIYTLEPARPNCADYATVKTRVDDLSAVDHVELWTYKAISGGTWQNSQMAYNRSSGLYEGTISFQTTPSSYQVEYYVRAYDIHGLWRDSFHQSIQYVYCPR